MWKYIRHDGRVSRVMCLLPAGIRSAEGDVPNSQSQDVHAETDTRRQDSCTYCEMRTSCCAIAHRNVAHRYRSVSTWSVSIPPSSSLSNWQPVTCSRTGRRPTHPAWPGPSSPHTSVSRHKCTASYITRAHHPFTPHSLMNSTGGPVSEAESL